MSKEKKDVYKYNRRSYIVRVLIAIDQLGNTIFGGDPDETLSAKAWRKHTESILWNCVRRGIDFMFFWEANHCYKAYLAEVRTGHKDQSHYKEKCDVESKRVNRE